jgi:hypothetical protein
MVLKRIEYMRDAGVSLLLSLLIFATFLVAVPIGSPVFAANPQLPSVTPSPKVVVGGTATAFTVTVGNPLANSFAITAITVTAPSGWSFAYVGASDPCKGALGTLVARTSSAFTCSGNLPPGQSVALGGAGSLTVTGPTPADANAIVGTFTTSVQDASSAAFYVGPTFKLYATGPSPSIAISFPSGDPCATGTYVAGSGPCSATATFSTTGSVGIAGVPITFSTDAQSSASPTSAFTDSSGKASTTWQPSNLVANSPSSLTASAQVASATFSVTITPSSPAKVIFTAPPSPHYVTTSVTIGTTLYAQVTTVTYSVADSFGNPISFSSISFGPTQGITLTAISGGGGFSNGGTPTSSISCTGAGCTWAGSLPPGFFYVQSSVFNAIGVISATITGTFSSSPFSVSGTSGNIITSTFATSAPTPAVSVTSVEAGKTVTVSATLSPAQQGVPVTLLLDSATSFETTPGDYGANSQLPAVFPNGATNITLSTDSTGKVSATFTVDTVAGSTAFFQSIVAKPTNANPSGTLGPSGDSPGVLTVAGPPAGFKIKLFFNSAMTQPVGTKVAAGATIFVNVAIVDKFGNPSSNPGPAAIQITLSASAGTLSATTVYIPTGGTDTASSFGPISWTMPTSEGTSVTLTASGVLGGSPAQASRTVTTVSPKPTIAVTSPMPVDGVIYSNSLTTIFSGSANVSVGKAPSVTISSVAFKLDNAPWTGVVVSPANKVVWSTIVSASQGLHTIQFNATDADGDVGVTPVMKFLVDTSPPSITFVTANNSIIQAGGAVQATIVDTLGDLNFTSVSATRNGTAIPSSSISISGTNNPGVNTTYSVSISGLPTGTWAIKITAEDLAGNSATSKVLVVTVIVPLDQSFTLVGAPTKVTVAGQTAINATFTNNLPFTQSGIVMLVVRNLQGQTVYIATATVSPAAGATFSALLVVSPVPPGTYTGELFAITSTGVVIAKSTTVSITLP